MSENRRVRYLCSGAGPASATALGSVSPLGSDGPALLLLGLFAVAGVWVFRRFGSAGGMDAGPDAEAETEPLVTAGLPGAIPELEQLDDDREPVLG